ncbi:MAG: GNAT family N-acetyltransferase [Aquabacterium sp.]|uniref:GNAT family N-acetyltransferase n=1 Tax=Aquabacterium sp. TaxID=1872578 RepID=UPI0025DEED24|nr:GNAT family N-acetyltransferase [uncultured Aquabacterium sp.]
MSKTPALDIVHHPEIGRFEAIVDGLRCEADYVLQGQVMRMTHTGVPRALEGRGIAAALVSHALGWAREQGYKVQPVCSYVAVYMRRHPEWQDLAA